MSLIPLTGSYRVRKRAYGKYVIQKKYGFMLWADEWFCESKEEAENFIKNITS